MEDLEKMNEFSGRNTVNDNVQELVDIALDKAMKTRDGLKMDIGRWNLSKNLFIHLGDASVIEGSLDYERIMETFRGKQMEKEGHVVLAADLTLSGLAYGLFSTNIKQESPRYFHISEALSSKPSGRGNYTLPIPTKSFPSDGKQILGDILENVENVLYSSIEVKGGKGGYLSLFRDYRFQVSYTNDGVGDQGSTPNVDNILSVIKNIAKVDKGLAEMFIESQALLCLRYAGCDLRDLGLSRGRLKEWIEFSFSEYLGGEVSV